MSDENATLNLVLERYKRAVKSDMQYLLEVEEARRMYASDQWVVRKNGRLILPQRPRHRVRLVINKLIPAVESIIGSYLQADPMINTDPGKPDDSARRAAEITRKVMRYYWRHLKMKRKLAKGILYACVDGNFWLRSRWDPRAGKKIPKFKEAAQLGEMAGRPMDYGDVEQWLPQGDPVADILMAGSFFMEPGAADLEDAAWCVAVEALKRDEVQQRFAKDIGKDGLKDEDCNFLDDHNPAFNPQSLAWPDCDQDKDRVVLYTCYERPTSKFPKGRLIYCTKGKELRTDPLPSGTMGPRIPIVQVTNIELVGEKNGTSVVTQAIPAQVEYNSRRSMAIEDIRLGSRPQILSPIGALDTDEVDNEPGKIIEWDPNMAQGERPEWMRGPGPSPAMYNEMRIAAEEIDDLMSRHDPSRGMTSGATSGKHAAAAREADNSRFSPSQWNLQEALTTWGYYLACDIRENLSGERVVTIVGENDKQDVVKFQAVDISDDCNIEFNLISQLEWSKEQMRQTVMWLYSVGLLEKQQALELLKFPIKDYLYEANYRHRVNARKENELLKAGMKFPPVPGDDNMVHMFEHLQELSTPEMREEILQFYNQTQAMGEDMQQPSQGMWPDWVIAIVTHAEQHRKAMPQPQPQPPRQSISLRGEIPPDQAAAIGNKAVGVQGAPEQPPGGQKGAQGLATPPGGMSGENYMQGGGEGPLGDAGKVPGGQLH